MKLFVFGLLFSLLSCSRTAAQGVRGADTVQVSGLVANALALSLRDGCGLPLKASPPHLIRNAKGELKKAVPAARGYLLKDILERAAPVIADHREQGRYVVIIAGADGYAVTFSYNELIYGPAGAKTWLMPVPGAGTLKDDGPFVLLSMADSVAAPRFVKWVKTIELRKI